MRIVPGTGVPWRYESKQKKKAKLKAGLLQNAKLYNNGIALPKELVLSSGRERKKQN